MHLVLSAGVPRYSTLCPSGQLLQSSALLVFNLHLCLCFNFGKVVVDAAVADVVALAAALVIDAAVADVVAVAAALVIDAAALILLQQL